MSYQEKITKLENLAVSLKKEQQQMLELEKSVMQDKKILRNNKPSKAFFIDPESSAIVECAGNSEWWNQATSLEAANRLVKYRKHSTECHSIREKIDEILFSMTNKEITTLIINSSEITRTRHLKGN